MLKILLPAFLFLLCLAAPAQKKTDPVKIFDAYVSASMPQWKIPGLSIAIVKNGKVVLQKGYGETEKGTGQPFTASTVAVCASTTKAMTAVCMALLVDDGKVSWDDKVSAVFPAFQLKDVNASSQITIRELFTHNTGLGNADLLWVNRYSNDSVIRQMRYIEPAYPLRSSFIYQNLMYLVAGEVIHHLSGKTWQDFITERLFKPLGMKHTYALFSRIAPEEKRITPHFIYPDSVVRAIHYPPYEVGAAGGVWSTAEDMSKWMLFMLDSTKIAGSAMLKAQTYSELFKPQVMGSPYPTAALIRHHWDTYGLGWFQHDYKGRILQYHTGSLDGATAITGLVPEEGFGIYIFGNLDHAELRHALLYKAIDLFCFNDNARDYSKEFFTLYGGFAAAARAEAAKADSGRVAGTHPSIALKEYAGHYENEIYGRLTVLLEKDSLLLSTPGDLRFRLGHWHYDTFKAQANYNWWLPELLQFFLTTGGKIGSLNFWGNVYKRKD